MELKDIISGLKIGNMRALAKAITLVENNPELGMNLLKQLDFSAKAPILGVTGAPGSGKSTLVNALATEYVNKGKKVAILAVDPSSPFNMGSILGDRLRMSRLFLNDSVFIRSISSRGSLGGISSTMVEISDLVAAYWWDLVIVETVGVGQSEVEVASLADTTIVVAVPEGGDDIQAMKSGLMEIADIFVVNKADRPGATSMTSFLQDMAHSRFTDRKIEVIETIANEFKGIEELVNCIDSKVRGKKKSQKMELAAKRAFEIISKHGMRYTSSLTLKTELMKVENKTDFNLYVWLEKYLND